VSPRRGHPGPRASWRKGAGFPARRARAYGAGRSRQGSGRATVPPLTAPPRPSQPGTSCKSNCCMRIAISSACRLFKFCPWRGARVLRRGMSSSQSPRFLHERNGVSSAVSGRDGIAGPVKRASAATKAGMHCPDSTGCTGRNSTGKCRQKSIRRASANNDELGALWILKAETGMELRPGYPAMGKKWGAARRSQRYGLQACRH